MWRVVALLLLVAFFGAGCSRAATPDLSAPANYRQMVMADANRVAGAVNTAHASCTGEAVEACREALTTQGAIARQETKWLRSVRMPQDCDRLAHNYLILVDDARYYFDRVQASAAAGDRAAVQQMASERYVSFARGWRAISDASPGDTCR